MAAAAAVLGEPPSEASVMLVVRSEAPQFFLPPLLTTNILVGGVVGRGRAAITVTLPLGGCMQGAGERGIEAACHAWHGCMDGCMHREQPEQKL